MSEAPNPLTGRQINQITKSTNKLLKKIRKCEALIENLKTLPYYTVFKRQTEQEKDIAKAEKKLQKLIWLFKASLIIHNTTHKCSYPSPLVRVGETK